MARKKTLPPPAVFTLHFLQVFSCWLKKKRRKQKEFHLVSSSYSKKIPLFIFLCFYLIFFCNFLIIHFMYWQNLYDHTVILSYSFCFSWFQLNTPHLMDHPNHVVLALTLLHWTALQKYNQITMRCGSFVTAVLILQRILDVIIDASLKVPVIRCIYSVRSNFLIYCIFKNNWQNLG